MLPSRRRFTDGRCDSTYSVVLTEWPVSLLRFGTSQSCLVRLVESVRQMPGLRPHALALSTVAHTTFAHAAANVVGLELLARRLSASATGPELVGVCAGASRC